MAVRVVYVPVLKGETFVVSCEVEFTWVPGTSLARRRLSRQSLHEAAIAAGFPTPILDISSYSDCDLGISLSALNLQTQWGVSLESIYQSGKVFEKGGPFPDIRDLNSVKAKTDPRLLESGTLLRYEFDGETWPLTPRSCFYTWLYLNALVQQPEKAKQVTDYRGFTDAAYSPRNKWGDPNCQAEAAALYVALHHRRMVKRLLASRDAFMEFMARPWARRVEEPPTP